MKDIECRDRLMLLAGELSTAAELGLWIYEGRDLQYTSSAHEEEFRNLFAVGGGWEFIAAYEEGCRTPVYFSDNLGLIWIGEHIFAKEEEAKGDRSEVLVLIGPMFISSVSEQSVEERLRSLDLSLRSRRQMEQALHDVSVVVYTMLEQYAHILHYMITLKPCPKEALVLEPQGLDTSEEERENANDEDAGIRGERLLLKAVKEGNRDFVRIMDTELNYTGKLLSRTGGFPARREEYADHSGSIMLAFGHERRTFAPHGTGTGAAVHPKD